MICPLTTPSLSSSGGWVLVYVEMAVCPRNPRTPPFLYQRFFLSLTNSYTYYNVLVPSGNASCVPLCPSSCYVGLQEAWAWLPPSLDGGQVGGYIFPPEPPVPRKGLPHTRNSFKLEEFYCRCNRWGGSGLQVCPREEPLWPLPGAPGFSGWAGPLLVVPGALCTPT